MIKGEVKGVIFDLDGTLVDSIADISAAANLMLQRHGYPAHGVEDYVKWIGNGAARLIEAALPGEISHETLRGFVKEFKFNYSENLHDKTRLYEGIPELLDFLDAEGMHLSILSNKPHELTVEVAKWYLSDRQFKAVYGQRDGVPRKPDPEAAIEIAGEMDLDPGNIIFLGDSKNDMVTAKGGGFIPVGVSWGYGSVESLLEGGAEYVIHDPKELIILLSD